MASPVSILETTDGLSSGDYFGNSRKRKADDDLSKIEKFMMEDGDDYSEEPEMTIPMLENHLFRSGNDPVLVPASGHGGGGRDLLLPSPLKRQKKEEEQEVVEIIMLDSDDDEEEEECPNSIFNQEIMNHDDEEPEMTENQVGIFVEELNQSIQSGDDDPVSRQSTSSGGGCDLLLPPQSKRTRKEQQEVEIIVLESDDEEDEERSNISTHQNQGAGNIDQKNEEDNWHFYNEEIWIAANNEHEQQGGWIDDQDYTIPDDSFLDILPDDNVM